DVISRMPQFLAGRGQGALSSRRGKPGPDRLAVAPRGKPCARSEYLAVDEARGSERVQLVAGLGLARCVVRARVVVTRKCVDALTHRTRHEARGRGSGAGTTVDQRDTCAVVGELAGPHALAYRFPFAACVLGVGEIAVLVVLRVELVAPVPRAEAIADLLLAVVLLTDVAALQVAELRRAEFVADIAAGAGEEGLRHSVAPALPECFTEDLAEDFLCLRQDLGDVAEQPG